MPHSHSHTHTRIHPAAPGTDRERIESALRHALTLPAEQAEFFLADYHLAITEMASKYPDSELAYTVLSDYADDFYERLVEESEAAHTA